MAFVFSVNNTFYGHGQNSNPTTDQMFFTWKTFMVANGWTVVQSSDGLTFSTNSDIITKSNTGSGGLGNAGSWFVIKEPDPGYGPSGQRREWLIFKNSTANTSALAIYRMIVYSFQGFSTTQGHGGAAISAVNPPIAFDMIWAINNTPMLISNPSQTAVYSQTDGTQYGQTLTWIWDAHFCLDTTTNAWYIMCPRRNVDGNPSPMGIYMHDTYTGYDGYDLDPTGTYCYNLNYAGSPYTSALNNLDGVAAQANYAFSASWHNRPLTFTSTADLTAKNGRVCGSYQIYARSISCVIRSTIGTGAGNVNNGGKHILISPEMYLQTPIIKFKGKSTLIKISLTDIHYALQAYNVSSTRDYIAIISPSPLPCKYALPWNGSVINW